MSEASYPDGLYYNEEHDWARVEGDVATFGITWYAQDSLGEVVYFSPSAVGSDISKGGEYGELESTKAVSSLVAPLSGEVTFAGAGPIAEAWPPEAGAFGFVWLKLPWNGRPRAASASSCARALSRSARAERVADATRRASAGANEVSSLAARRRSFRSDGSRIVVAALSVSRLRHAAWSARRT